MQKIGSLQHSSRFPYWLRQSVRLDADVVETQNLIRDLSINTVCQSARCPNIYDCFSKKRCTFLILGDICTRNCKFCSVQTKVGHLQLPQKEELLNIREAVKRLNLQDVVITSVTRDDLDDGGASHFANCVEILRELDAELSIEVLVPDFLGKKNCIEEIVKTGVDIFAHNIETVPRLYKKVRPEADYDRSLNIIRYVKELDSMFPTKSGLMVGLGEYKEEIYSTMEDLKSAGCDIITIGQYLSPDVSCLEVEEFLEQDEFVRFSEWAKELGFRDFSCSPFTRSSYMDVT